MRMTSFSHRKGKNLPSLLPVLTVVHFWHLYKPDITINKKGNIGKAEAILELPEYGQNQITQNPNLTVQ